MGGGKRGGCEAGSAVVQRDAREILRQILWHDLKVDTVSRCTMQYQVLLEKGNSARGSSKLVKVICSLSICKARF